MCRWLTSSGVPTSLEAWRAKPIQEQVDLRTIRRMSTGVSLGALAAAQDAAEEEG